MNKAKSLLHRLYHPRPAWFFPFAVGIFLAEIWIFRTGRENSPLAYVIYPLSAYALSAVVAVVFRILKRWFLSVPLFYRLATDVRWRTELLLRFGLLFNVIYAVFKILSGIHYDSDWMITAGSYYAVTGIVTFYLTATVLRENSDSIGAQDAADGQVTARLRRGLVRCRRCGLLLILVGISLLSITGMVVRNGETVRYPGYLIYAMAAYAFFCVITSVINLWKYRQLQDPVQSAVRRLNFVKALYAIYMLQIAMITAFSEQDLPVYRWANLLSGLAAAIAILLMALALILRANAALKELRA